MTPELIERLRAGDGEAGQLLDSSYRAAMLRFCRGYLGSAEEAEDAIQEIFCKVLATTQVPENFRAWLYRIARNHCLNLIRTRKRRRTDDDLPPDTQLHDEQTGNLTRLIRIEQHQRLADLLAMLSSSQREALRLRYTEGLSRAEVAEVLELPESVVKSRLFEGIKALREHTSLLTDR